MLLSLLTSVLLLGYKLRDTTRLGAVWNKRQDMEKQRAKLARQEAVFAAEMADAQEAWEQQARKAIRGEQGMQMKAFLVQQQLRQVR